MDVFGSGRGRGAAPAVAQQTSRIPSTVLPVAPQTSRIPTPATAVRPGGVAAGRGASVGLGGAGAVPNKSSAVQQQTLLPRLQAPGGGGSVRQTTDRSETAQPLQQQQWRQSQKQQQHVQQRAEQQRQQLPKEQQPSRAEQIFLKTSAEQQETIRRLTQQQRQQSCEDNDSSGSDGDEVAGGDVGASGRRQAVLKSLMRNFLVSSSSSSSSPSAAEAGNAIILTADASPTLRSSSTSADECATDGEASASLGRTSGYLDAALSAEGNVCLICLETIKRTAAMWNCSMCYCMFHMQCIQKWIKEGAYQKSVPQLSDELFPNRSLPWFCPKCRNEYTADSAPSRYYCYCRKVVDPPADPWLVPHSCGQACGRPVGSSCDHKCLLLCHPGPCPPCPKTVEVACHCGKQQPQRQRCGTKGWSCGKTCGRVLECDLHRCDKICHVGNCPPCTRTTMRRCQCGKEVTAKPCTERSWQCTQPCGLRLACSKHTCEQACHVPGACGPCPRAGRRSCPCGRQTSAAEVPCDVEVPTCRDTCGKLLECGVHRCTLKCHYGWCGQCLEVVRKTCGCSAAREKELPCYKAWTCDVKCQRMRACGRHPCKRKCCDGITCPPCELTCGRALPCHNHRCSAPCHEGPCYPCPLTVDVKCFCGSSRLSVPCGGERVTKPPKCDKPCRIPPECHHTIPLSLSGSSLPPLWHRCHFGPCPPCRQACGKRLEGCEHSCPALCHSAVREQQVAADGQQTGRVGPWQPLPATVVRVVSKPCPPCAVPLPVTCLGGHETCNVPCSKATPSSCLRKCGRLLACGNHTCSLDCHVVEESASHRTTSVGSPAAAGSNCQSCEEPCGRERPAGCDHECMLPCHPGDCPPCSQMLRMRCHCGAYVKHVECAQWTATACDEPGRSALQACDGACSKEMPCGHNCGLPCHAGPCNTCCSKKTTIRCPCKRRKEVHPCSAVTAGHVKVACDEVCQEQQQKQREAEQVAERLRLEEQRQREQAELDMYERKLTGRGRAGRRRRCESADEEEPSVWYRRGWQLAAVFGVILALLAGAVTLTYQ